MGELTLINAGHPPELVVSISHLVRPQFGHEDLDDVYEYEEVNLNREENIIMPWLRPLCHISRTKLTQQFPHSTTNDSRRETGVARRMGEGSQQCLGESGNSSRTVQPYDNSNIGIPAHYRNTSTVT